MTPGSKVRVRLDARGTFSNGCTGVVVGPSAFQDDRVDVVFDDDDWKRPVPFSVAMLEEAHEGTWRQATLPIVEECPPTLPAPGQCSEPNLTGAE